MSDDLHLLGSTLALLAHVQLDVVLEKDFDWRGRCGGEVREREGMVWAFGFVGGGEFGFWGEGG